MRGEHPHINRVRDRWLGSSFNGKYVAGGWRIMVIIASSVGMLGLCKANHWYHEGERQLLLLNLFPVAAVC